MRLVQLTHPEVGRKIALVREPQLVLISAFPSIYALAMRSLDEDVSLAAMVEGGLSQVVLDYDSIYAGTSDWQLLPAFDHPDPLHCMLSGTGLTHKASAQNRQQMHAAEQSQELTDSMIMYQWGVAGGRPKAGTIGVQPEWFYKGNGTNLRGHGQKLEIPPFANGGGEEPEVAGVYINDREGRPFRLGFAAGNEFSDHVMERKNYLYLAPAKIRTCSIGPELVLTHDFKHIEGRVSVTRSDTVIWKRPSEPAKKIWRTHWQILNTTILSTPTIRYPARHTSTSTEQMPSVLVTTYDCNTATGCRSIGRA